MYVFDCDWKTLSALPMSANFFFLLSPFLLSVLGVFCWVSSVSQAVWCACPDQWYIDINLQLSYNLTVILFQRIWWSIISYLLDFNLWIVFLYYILLCWSFLIPIYADIWSTVAGIFSSSWSHRRTLDCTWVENSPSTAIHTCIFFVYLFKYVSVHEKPFLVTLYYKLNLELSNFKDFQNNDSILI